MKQRLIASSAFILAAWLATAASAQTDSSAWTSDRVVAPADRAGGTKLLRATPSVPLGQGTVPRGSIGSDAAVFTTRTPQPAPGGVPKLPSSMPLAGDSTVAKSGSGGDLAYEAFDLGRYQQALVLAKAGAEKGEPQSATLIGRLYQEGLGVPRDDVQAAQWYRRGAEQGDVNAMFAFGVMLAEGGALKKDRNGAAQMFETAAAKGHVVANYNLAMLFLSGDGKPQNPRRAFAHLAYAADKGLPQAQYDLATLYATGTGTDANAFDAARWFDRAAAAGVPEAQLDFGVILFQGKGTPVDERRGAELFRQAAEKGNAVAQNRFARCLLHGRGITANAVEAAKWHLIAKASGEEDQVLDQAHAKLSKADRTKAEQAAGDWRDRAAVLQ
jgi:uncharacterized protein